MNINQNHQDALARRIRARYTESQPTRLDELKALERRVTAPARAFAFAFDTLAALVLGAGMSLIMTDLGTILGLADPLHPGLAVGIAGLLMAICNYPVYRGILRRRRKRYASRILALSDAVMAL